MIQTLSIIGILRLAFKSFMVTARLSILSRIWHIRWVAFLRENIPGMGRPCEHWTWRWILMFNKLRRFKISWPEGGICIGALWENNRRWNQITQTLLFSLFPNPNYRLLLFFFSWGRTMRKPGRGKCCYVHIEGKPRYSHSPNRLGIGGDRIKRLDRILNGWTPSLWSLRQDNV